MSFSASFLTVLVYLALTAVALGIALLVALLLRDSKDKSLW